MREIGMLNPFGIKVIESPYALEFCPAKEHKKKTWMRESYHKRIQKKWNKRFGKTSRPGVYQTPMGLVVHPEIAKVMREALQEQNK